VLEPAFHVPQAILVGDQFDEAGFAVFVQRLNFVGRQRTGIFPDFFVAAISKRVLHVQLKLIDFPAGQLVDDLEKRLQRGNFVAADVEHQAAHGEIGPVFDFQAGKGRGEKTTKLLEGLVGVENGGGIGCRNSGLGDINNQMIVFARRKRRIQFDDHRTRAGSGVSADFSRHGKQGQRIGGKIVIHRNRRHPIVAKAGA
jgi:hypothetical protein